MLSLWRKYSTNQELIQWGREEKLLAFFLLLRPDKPTLGSVWLHSPGSSGWGARAGSPQRLNFERVQCCSPGKSAVLQTCWGCSAAVLERVQSCSPAEGATLQSWRRCNATDVQSMQCCSPAEHAVLQTCRRCSAADIPPAPSQLPGQAAVPLLTFLSVSGPAAETNQSHKPLGQCIGKGRTDTAEGLSGGTSSAFCWETSLGRD